MRLRAAIAVLLFASSAHAFNLRTGSWGYEYPTDWFVKPDGQSLTLTGSAGFTFKGYIADYWIDVNRCQANAEIIPCPMNTIRVNWYTGTHDKGIGLVGVATLNGVTYPNVGKASSTARIRFQTNGTLTLPPLGKNGDTKVKTIVTPIIGTFVHGGVTSQITGNVLVTVEFEQENGAWVIEDVDYDVVN